MSGRPSRPSRPHRAVPPRPLRRGRDEASDAGLGGTQVEGRHAVRELLAVGRRRTLEVAIQRGQDESPVLDEITELARRAGVPVRIVGPETLGERARSEVHQGVIARAEPVVPVELSALVEPSASRPFLLALDGVTDPHNLGAVLRSALGAGVSGVILPKRRSVHLTPTVAKAAAGSIEHLSIALVPGIPSALERLAKLGVWTVGLDAGGEVELDDVAVLTEPVVLVLGAEGDGLSPLTRARCEVLARIELVGPLESLNVSAAGAVACFAVSRARRRQAGLSAPPR